MFSCQINGFLFVHHRSDHALNPPFKLLINGKVLQKPYLGVPIQGTREFFLIARAPQTVPRRPRLELCDAAADSIQASPGSLAFSSAVWRKHVPGPVTPAVLAYVCDNLETLFGSQTPEFWGELANRFAELTEAAVIPLPDGRVYARIGQLAGEDGPAMTRLSVGPSPHAEGNTETFGLIDHGKLYTLFDAGGMTAGPHGHLWIRLGQSAVIPLRIADFLGKPPALDPYGEIVGGPGDGSPALADYLRKIAGIRPLLDACGRKLVAGLKGSITELQGDRLIGWALDANDPAEAIEIGISVDGDPLQTVRADLPPASVSERERIGHHGFALRLPKSLLDGKNHSFRITLPGRPDYPLAQTFRIGPGQFDGGARLDGGRRLTGWLRERCLKPNPLTVQFLIDQAVVSTREIATADGGERSCYEFDLPHWVHDGTSHTLETRAYRPGQEAASLGEPVSYQARYRGALVKLDATQATGWIVNDSAPRLPIALDLYVNGIKEFTAETKPVRDRNGRSVFGFTFYLDVPKPGERYRAIAFYIAGTRHRVLGPDRLLTPLDSILESLTRATGLVRSADPDGRTHEWIRRQLLAPVIGELRKTGSLPASLTLNLAPVIQAVDRRPAAEVVDIVVPVHSGLEQTLECLDSLESANADGRCEIVVVNDGSPEPELSERLRERASAGRITLLENPRNLGFVASANRGLRLHPERDVILLNSDTVVPLRWTERLRRVAYGNGAIGTVTPLSNNATICSFPRPNADNRIPPGWTLAELDRAFHQANGDGCHDLPTAVGYCMYIKRQLMDEIGYLDEHEWGKGYAEENDFCLRAAALGWRSVSADGVFVQHHGSVSFGEDKSPLLAANLAKLYRLYPDYPATVQRFIADDPLAEARNPVIQLLLRRHAPRYLLFVSHELGGGSQVAIDDLCRGLDAEGQAVLELRSQPDGKWLLQAHGTGYAASYRPEDFDRLIADLRELSVWHVHYHQIPFFPRRITELPGRLDVAYDVTVHDYLPLCPRINMMDETGFYCGESQYDPATCNRCIAALGPGEGVESLYDEHGKDVAAWRAHHGEFLGRARRVFLPSQAVAQLLKPHWALANAAVRPHPEPRFRLKPTAALASPIVKVAVIGAIGTHKGFDLLLACARSACKDGLPLHFVVIGYTQDDAAFDRLDNVTVTGPYRREQLDGLLRRHGCQVAAFLSPWPETYCYALTEAWRGGLYPVALDLGAQAERIRTVGYGDVLPLTADPKRLNRGLLDAAQRVSQPTKRATVGMSYPSIMTDYYGFEAPAAVPKPAPRRRRNPEDRALR